MDHLNKLGCKVSLIIKSLTKCVTAKSTLVTSKPLKNGLFSRKVSNMSTCFSVTFDKSSLQGESGSVSLLLIVGISDSSARSPMSGNGSLQKLNWSKLSDFVKVPTSSALSPSPM